MNILKKILPILLSLTFILTACGGGGITSSGFDSYANPCDAEARSLRIMADGGVQSLIEQGVFNGYDGDVSFVFRGSVDIKNTLAGGGNECVDAYWAASQVWMPGRFTSGPFSVARTIPGIAVTPELKASLGWGNTIVSTQLNAAIQSGQLNLAMASASQDDAAATVYLAQATAFCGEDILSAECINNPSYAQHFKELFASVTRSAQHSGAMTAIFYEDRKSGANEFNSIVLYESLLVKLNQDLVKAGLEPMQFVYITDASVVADLPIAFIENESQAWKAEEFEKLTAFLSSDEVKERLTELGWRTNYVGLSVDSKYDDVFNPSWGIDPSPSLFLMTYPKQVVIDYALNAYQAFLRKPSYTVYCLDYSGSMFGNGGYEQMVNAMDLLLDQNRAVGVYLQATAEDVTVVYGFESSIWDLGSVHGNDPAQMKALSTTIATANISGNTAMFSCVQAGLEHIAANYSSEYQYSVIAMTDGQSNSGLSSRQFKNYYEDYAYPVPVFGIAFANADEGELSAFRVTGGDYYLGNDDIVWAFRQAKANN